MIIEPETKKNGDPEIGQYPDFDEIEKDQIIEKRTVYDDELIRGTGQEWLMDGVHIWHGKFRATMDKRILVRSSASHVQMNFSLQNTVSYFPESHAKPFLKLIAHQHNLLLLPERNILVYWQPEQDTEAFTINLTTEFFFNHLPETHPLSGRLEKGIRENVPAFLSNKNLPVTPEMITTLHELLHCNYSGYHKCLFVKAKVIELLAQQLEQYEQLEAKNGVTLKKEDADKMFQAREILIKNLEQPLSLKDLAHQVGTNEFNLKKHFKVIFGTTVFGYLNDFRMQQAKDLLCQEGSKISEIANRMGYKHATHFTAAFKKHFGYLPNKVRIALIQICPFSDYFIELATEFTERFLYV